MKNLGKLYDPETKSWISIGESTIRGAEEALEYAMRHERYEPVDHEEVKQVALKDPAVRAEYERLGTNGKYHQDFSTVVCFAFRYALGRQSMAPGFMQDYIRDNIECFDTYELEQWIGEVDEAARWHGLGDPTIDEPMWRQFQRDLLLEISKRSAIIEETGGSDE